MRVSGFLEGFGGQASAHFGAKHSRSCFRPGDVGCGGGQHGPQEVSQNLLLLESRSAGGEGHVIGEKACSPRQS